MGTRKLVCGNWKMNLGQTKAKSLAAQVAECAKTLKQTDAWVAPVFTSIAAVAEAVKGTPVKFGAQNVHWEESGAFTGEIAPGMLKELGCSFAIVGHSERRHVFGESDALIAKRAVGGLKAGLGVIFCIGEKLDERESGKTNQVLAAQLDAVLAALTGVPTEKLVIAYEPVWAIGTGKVAGIQEIEAAHGFVHQHWTAATQAACPPILYGGSVTPDNFGAIVKVPRVDGALVGGASLSIEKFAPLLQIAEG